MSTIGVLVTALALAMDAMSLSIYQGIASTESQKKQNFLKIVLTFGIFQFTMALVGSLSGTLFIHYISLYSKYISFAIFLFLGLMMLREALKKEKMEYDEKYLDFKTLIMMGIATSLDSLLVGLTFSILPFYQTFLYTVEIGIVTAIIAGLGFILGEKFGNILGQKSYFLGAVLLIFIAINIFDLIYIDFQNIIVYNNVNKVAKG